MRGLADKGVFIAGGTRGIGLATAQRFLMEGARVFVCGREADEVALALRSLAEFGPIAGVSMDVRNPAQVQATIEQASEVLRGVDILISNIGVVRKAPFLHITLDEWDDLYSVNLRGMFLMTQGVARRMMARGQGGVILLMASKNGLIGEPQLAHYNATKGGVIQLMKTMAVELGLYGIRVNALCPGYIRTPMNEEVDSPEFIADYARRIPLGRVGDPDEVAAAYAFLASDEASWLHGATFVLDGGHLARQA